MSTIERIFVPKFSLKQIAQALDKPEPTLRYWLSEGWVKPDDHDIRGTRGVAAYFSFSSAMRFALASEIIAFGEKPRAAFIATEAFTSTNATDVDEDGHRISDRAPGRFFETGETVLICWRSEKLPESELHDHHLLTNPVAKVMRVKRCLPLSLFHTVAAGNVGQSSFLAVSCNKTIKRFAAKLGAQHLI